MSKQLIFILLLTCLLSSANGFQEWWQNSKVMELNEENFFSVIGQDKYVIVKFYAKWCHFCKVMAPDFEKIHDHYSKTRKDIVIARLEGSDNEEIAYAYRIFSFPMVLFFKPKQKQIISVHQKSRTFDLMKEWIDEQTKEVLKLDTPKSTASQPSPLKADSVTSNPSNTENKKEEPTTPVKKKELGKDQSNSDDEDEEDNLEFMDKEHTDQSLKSIFETENGKEHKVANVTSESEFVENEIHLYNKRIEKLERQVKILGEQVLLLKNKPGISSQMQIPSFYTLAFVVGIVLFLVAMMITIKKIFFNQELLKNQHDKV